MSSDDPITESPFDSEALEEALETVPSGKNPYIYDEMPTDERDLRDAQLEDLINEKNAD